MRSRAALRAAMIVLALAAAAAFATPAGATPPGGPEWRLETRTLPVEGGGSPTPVGLGSVGDIQFLAPNLGLLITAGNGEAVPPGVWAYNGTGWHELANVCGATDGRIAWAGPEEFWTVSDGRPGQAPNSNGFLPPLADNTLCHFASGRVLTSYASLAFNSNSYQVMSAAACLGAAVCWFGGAPLPAPQQGAFQLHWNGATLAAEPNPRARSLGDIRGFEGHLYESVPLPLEPPNERQTIEEILHPPTLYEIAADGAVPPFPPVRPKAVAHPPNPPETLPEYAPGSFPAALEYLHLSADQDSLWAVAEARQQPPSGSGPGKLTVLRQSGGVWSQVLGPEGTHSVAITPPGLAEAGVASIAAEPGTASAWMALPGALVGGVPSPTAVARVVHLSAAGAISEEELPSKKQREAGIAPRGAGSRITCPAQNDCWLVTTQGWLFHLSEAGSETLPLNPDPMVNGPLITFRPPDEGVPQILPDAPPAEVSEERPPVFETIKPTRQTFATVPAPLVTHVHSRLIHGNTLELTFQLTVKARVRLVAKRRRAVVASTRTRTLARGRRRLLLVLDPHRWPTKLDLQTRALAPLPMLSTREGSVETVGTSLVQGNGNAGGPLGRWR